MSVVMLSGPVGAGKTTVAQQLMKISSAPLCYIEGDAFWSLFAKPDAGPGRERFRLLMRSLTAAAVPLARGGYEVLLDFSFPLDFLDTARKILKEIPLVCDIETERRKTSCHSISRYGLGLPYRISTACLKGRPSMRFLTMRAMPVRLLDASMTAWIKEGSDSADGGRLERL